MDNCIHFYHCLCRQIAATLALVIAAMAIQTGLCSASAATGREPFSILPETKLKITVVEWIASEGDYKEWTALGGEYAVAADGTIDMPLVGLVEAAGRTTPAIAADLAALLKRKTGLVEAPAVSVQISAYPPVYVSGSVERPGAVDYRPGLRVMQAVALAGGRERRFDRANRYMEMDQIRFAGDLHRVEVQIAQQLARKARLEAELAEASAISYPEEFEKLRSNPAIAKIAIAEETVFTNRRDALQRQLSTLSDLGDLLKREIAVLDEKMNAQDRQIEIARKELQAIAKLVTNGTSTRSREASLERVVADLESSKLDMVVASMRARQKVSETSRDASQLIGQRKTEVSRDLQQVESELEDLRLRRDTTLQLLAATGAILERTGREEDLEQLGLSYAILRAGSSGALQPADENTILQPGDLLQVAIRIEPSLGGMRSSSVVAAGDAVAVGNPKR